MKIPALFLALAMTVCGFSLRAQPPKRSVSRSAGRVYRPVRFQHILMAPDPRYDSTIKDSAIDYPIVVSDDTAVGRVINAMIELRLMGRLDGKKTVREKIRQWREEMLTSMRFHATLNDGKILSITVDYETMTAYPSRHTEYFNFDARTAMRLDIENVFAAGRLEELRRAVMADKVKALDAHAGELRQLMAAHPADSDAIQAAIGQVINCRKTLSLDRFRLGRDSISIMDDCDLPHYIQCYTPNYELKYGFADWSDALTPFFREYGGESRARFREIRAIPSKRFDYPQDTTIVYPIVVLKDSVAAKRINNVIRQQVFLEDEDEIANKRRPGVRQFISEWKTNALGEISYEVNLNAGGYLSLLVYVEEGGHHLIRHSYYFNFDLPTGHEMTLEDLAADRIALDSLRGMVQRKRWRVLGPLSDSVKRRLERMKESEGEDDLDVAGTMETVTSWSKDPDCSYLVLSKDSLEIIDQTEFPSRLVGFDEQDGLNFKVAYADIRNLLGVSFRRRMRVPVDLKEVQSNRD